MGTGGGPSSQEDLSEVDKKVLAIIGEQAVFGDSAHRVPIFVSCISSTSPTKFMQILCKFDLALKHYL